MYNEQMEDPFLKATEQEYIKKSNHWISEMNCPEYLDRVSKMLALEENNADFWLEPASKPKVMRIVEKQLITVQAEAAVSKQTGCKFMFTHSRLDELATMYRVYKRDEDSLKHIINCMNPYIVERGEKIV
jgi:cullin 3